MAEVQKSYPAKVNIYNLKNFFNFKTVSTNQIIPGMIISFGYRSPEGVHDSTPLIYVLEVEGDRIWGINLHYKFALLGEVIQYKRAEVQKVTPTKQEAPVEKPIEDNSRPRPEQLNQKNIPSLPEFKKVLGTDKPTQPTFSKPSYPIQLLEHYTLTQQPKELLRNYLYPRMTSVQKLVFKTL